MRMTWMKALLWLKESPWRRGAIRKCNRRDSLMADIRSTKRPHSHNLGRGHVRSSLCMTLISKLATKVAQMHLIKLHNPRELQIIHRRSSKTCITKPQLKHFIRSGTESWMRNGKRSRRRSTWSTKRNWSKSMTRPWISYLYIKESTRRWSRSPSSSIVRKSQDPESVQTINQMAPMLLEDLCIQEPSPPCKARCSIAQQMLDHVLILERPILPIWASWVPIRADPRTADKTETDSSLQERLKIYHHKSTKWNKSKTTMKKTKKGMRLFLSRSFTKSIAQSSRKMFQLNVKFIWWMSWSNSTSLMMKQWMTIEWNSVQCWGSINRTSWSTPNQESIAVNLKTLSKIYSKSFVESKTSNWSKEVTMDWTRSSWEHIVEP